MLGSVEFDFDFYEYDDMVDSLREDQDQYLPDDDTNAFLKVDALTVKNEVSEVG